MNPLEGAHHALRIAHLTLQIQAVEDVDALLDHYIDTAPDDVDQIPYYATLWPSARALAEVLCARPPQELTGARVIELGCGLGLPSLAAAALGADVLATDFHADNQTHFEHNAALNGLTIPYARLAWSDAEPTGRFDLVIGSDLLYERRYIPDLVRCAVGQVRPGGTILLADPGRDGLPQAVQCFEAHGWHAREQIHREVFVVEFRSERS